MNTFQIDSNNPIAIVIEEGFHLTQLSKLNIKATPVNGETITNPLGFEMNINNKSGENIEFFLILYPPLFSSNLSRHLECVSIDYKKNKTLFDTICVKSAKQNPKIILHLNKDNIN